MSSREKKIGLLKLLYIEGLLDKDDYKYMLAGLKKDDEEELPPPPVVY